MSEIIFYVVGALVVSFCFVVFFGSPYVPTLKLQVQDAMKILPLKNNDIFVDVGSGDGVVLRAAAKVGVRVAVGYELSPWLYAVSKILCRDYKNINIHLANFWKAELPNNTTVVYTFLNGRHIVKLAKKLQDHANKHGKSIQFISYGFALPEKKAVKIRGALYLYTFKPLQT